MADYDVYFGRTLIGTYFQTGCVAAMTRGAAQHAAASDVNEP